MKASHIYINPQGAPCAITKGDEWLRLNSGQDRSEKFAIEVKQSAIRIREKDQWLFINYNLSQRRDIFVSVEPYEFEVIEMKTSTGLQAGNVENGFKDIAFDISKAARIIRPSEPKQKIELLSKMVFAMSLTNLERRILFLLKLIAVTIASYYIFKLFNN